MLSKVGDGAVVVGTDHSLGLLHVIIKHIVMHPLPTASSETHYRVVQSHQMADASHLHITALVVGVVVVVADMVKVAITGVVAVPVYPILHSTGVINKTTTIINSNTVSPIIIANSLLISGNIINISSSRIINTAIIDTAMVVVAVVQELLDIVPGHTILLEVVVTLAVAVAMVHLVTIVEDVIVTMVVITVAALNTTSTRHNLKVSLFLMIVVQVES